MPRHVAFDRLRGAAIGAIEDLPARCNACRFAFSVGGKPDQLLDGRRAISASLNGMVAEMGRIYRAMKAVQDR
jgi:hypothetical protein